MDSYSDAVERGFGCEVDYGQISKTYSVVNLNKDAASRYCPAEVVKTEKTIVNGMPDIRRISTSHIEKQNHTLRMHCRRLTRLTNAFSKKFMTPAQAAGVEASAWTVAELVERCGE
jgi:hypothetical protein